VKTLNRFALAIGISFCANASGGETEWPQFRGPTGQGLSAAVNVPTQWSADDNVAWKTEIPGKGWSSPVLSQGRLYLTTAVGEAKGTDVSLRALCVDAAEGRILWGTEIFRPDSADAGTMHRKNSLASPSPIITGDRLYVHFGHMGTAALDLSGKVLWRQTELKYSPVHGTGGSPILVDGSLIFSCDGKEAPFLVALDAATGKVRWKTARDSIAKRQFSFSTPLVIQAGGATQVISPASGFVGGYDPGDGRELWRVTYGDGYSVVPRPVFAHGLIFVSSGFNNAILHAIRPDGAKGNVTETNVAWTQNKAVPKSASMLVLGDEIYFVADNGIANCADARTGEVHWSERLNGGFSTSPIAAEGRIYFQNETGTTYVIKSGKTFELLAQNEIGEPTLASYAVADGTLYLRSEIYLRKIIR